MQFAGLRKYGIYITDMGVFPVRTEGGVSSALSEY